MRELLPIKIKITLGGNGMHKFPAFNTLPRGLRDNMDWSTFFDARGIGWHYDRFSGLGEVDHVGDANDAHRNDDTECWFGVTCVPEGFARAAAQAFPGEVEILSEESLEEFYDNRAHALEDDVSIDAEALNRLMALNDAEERAGVGDPAERARRLAEAVDPDNRARGASRNRRRRWKDFKAFRGIKIVGK